MQPLYCIASIHGAETAYNWFSVPRNTAESFPSTPIVHVSCPGVYGCDVSVGDCSVPSALFEVTMSPGELTLSLQFVVHVYHVFPPNHCSWG